MTAVALTKRKFAQEEQLPQSFASYVMRGRL